MKSRLLTLWQHDGLRTTALVLVAVGLAMAVTSCLILLSGISPVRVFGAIWRGAFGSMDRVIFGLNKSTPYILAGIGVVLCFRAKIINIGADGQIALGGIGATMDRAVGSLAARPDGGAACAGSGPSGRCLLGRAGRGHPSAARCA